MTTQTETDVRQLAKWLNEEQTGPIDKQALARVLATIQAQPEQEPESIWIGTGHLREILNGNTMNAYCSPEQDRFTDVQLYLATPQRKPQLTARLVSYPESNGKKNWTAMFVRTQPWDGLQGNAGGITIDRGECWNRVAYNAERARFLLGERTTEPSILEYGNDVKTPEEWEGKDSEAAHGVHAAKQLKGDAA